MAGELTLDIKKENAKKAQAKYRKTDKYKIVRKRYEQSETGKAKHDRYRNKHKDKIKIKKDIYNKQYNIKNAIKITEQKAGYREKNRKEIREKQNLKSRKHRAQVKYEVLAHYSILDIPVCAHPDCLVMDMDMLCLDHINDDGKKDRERLNTNGGWRYYELIISNKYPEGHQVLCWNHNMKKDIQRRRGVQ